MELNENYNAETWLAEWWPIVLANFRVIKNAYDAEKAARAAADTRLTSEFQSAIRLESEARNKGDQESDLALADEKRVRAEADDAIANGTRVINANLGSGTKMTSALIKNDWLKRDVWDIISRFANLRLITHKASALGYVGGVFVVPEESIYIIENDTAVAFSRFNATDETKYILSEPIAASTSRICIVMSRVITGADPENGSLYVMDSDAMTAYEDSVAEITGMLDDIEELKANVPTSATAAEIREAWNPTPEPEPEPVTPTVTIEGEYDDVNSALIVTSTELAKLAAIDESETFDLVINATGVVYSGAAKYVTYIGVNSNEEPPGYGFTGRGLPLWDSEYDYDTFHDCTMVSQYDSVDNGEIREGSY